MVDLRPDLDLGAHKGNVPILQLQKVDVLRNGCAVAIDGALHHRAECPLVDPLPELHVAPCDRPVLHTELFSNCFALE